MRPTVRVRVYREIEVLAHMRELTFELYAYILNSTILKLTVT